MGARSIIGPNYLGTDPNVTIPGIIGSKLGTKSRTLKHGLKPGVQFLVQFLTHTHLRLEFVLRFSPFFVCCFFVFSFLVFLLF